MLDDVEAIKPVGQLTQLSGTHAIRLHMGIVKKTELQCAP